MALVVKYLPANTGEISDPTAITGVRRFPGGGNGNPLQAPGLEKPVDRGAWWATVNGVAKSGTQLSTHTCIYSKSGKKYGESPV